MGLCDDDLDIEDLANGTHDFECILTEKMHVCLFVCVSVCNNKHVLYVSRKIEKIESAGKLLGNKDYRAYFLI